MSSRRRVWWAAAAAVTVALAGCGGSGGHRASTPKHVVEHTHDSAPPVTAHTVAAVSVPFADATTARDALLQVARTASYAPNPSDPYAVDAVFRAWQASAPGLQLGSSISAATPTRVSSSGDFVTDKTSGDSVLWFTVTDTSQHCTAGAVALPASAGPNDPPTIFAPVDATHLSSCSASALVEVGLPPSTH